ncbi:MAG: Transcriptional regulator, LuxR family [Deltaproteobacteria bacterium]|nr:Transcriptional regulator, LuxR family [Deltaproteobacteria bacterium]
MRAERDLLDLEERLATIDPVEPAATWFVAALQHVARCDTVAAWSYKFGDGRLSVASFACVGSVIPNQQVTAMLNAWVGANHRAPGSYDHQRPEPWQRGRVIITPSPSNMLRDGAPARYHGKLVHPDEVTIETCLRPTGGDRPTARVLVCDGASLLAHVALFDEHELRHGQHAILRRLVGPLTKRLQLERRLEDAETYKLGVEAAMEFLPVAAFLLSSRGVIGANRVARAWIDADPTVPGSLLRRAGPDPALFDVTALRAGATTHYLALRRTTGLDTAARLAVKARVWKLTPRETEVAGWIVKGATNRAIADELGCAESTVETHVTRILCKAEVESRGELVVNILS